MLKSNGYVLAHYAITIFIIITRAGVRVADLQALPWAGNLSLHHRVQTGSGAHPASYPMGTGISFPGGKAAEA
jgi:hypothetical protein